MYFKLKLRANLGCVVDFECSEYRAEVRFCRFDLIVIETQNCFGGFGKVEELIAASAHLQTGIMGATRIPIHGSVILV